MATTIEQGTRCLNCGSTGTARFCSACGQRVLPPYPTLHELAAESWQEWSGYDGRIALTVRRLLLQPGRLTVDLLEGRRLRYLSASRLYLIASFLYFLVAATTPNVLRPPAPAIPSGRIQIDLLDPQQGMAALTPEQREQVHASVARAPGWLRPALQAYVAEPQRVVEAFRRNLPRLLFALVPVFAAIVAVFYRRRPFPQHVIFALHIHAALFLTFALARLTHLTGLVLLAALAQGAAAVFMAAYAARAFRHVYRASWAGVLVKGIAIAVVYGLVTGAAFVGMFLVSLG